MGVGSDGKFDDVKGDFRDVIHRAKFRAYLIKTLTKPLNEKDFIAWVREAKKLEPVKLGLDG